MSKTAKIWLIIGACLMLAGCIIFGGVMTVLKWDFSKLSTINMETNKYEITEQFKDVLDFKDIKISTKTAKINFVPSEDSKIKVVCYEQKKVKHSVTVKENILAIEAVDSRKWYEYIGINFGTPQITVYLPKGEYGALSVKTNTGDTKIPADFSFKNIEIQQSTGDVENLASATGSVNIKTTTGDITLKSATMGGLDLTLSTGQITAENINCNGDIKLSLSTGDAELNNVKCKNIVSSGSTGDLDLNNVIAEKQISAKRSTGDIKFLKCDAAEIIAKTSTGNVNGTLLSDKVFITQSDTGNIDVPNSVTGGKCEITTDTGNIKFTIEK